MKSLILLWTIALFLFFIHPTQNANRIQKWIYGLNPLSLQPFTTLQLPCVPEMTHAWRMNDPVSAYWNQSYLSGIGQPVRFQLQINKMVNQGKLVKLLSNENYLVDTLFYSVPYVVPHVKVFLDTLSARFNAKLLNTDLKGTQLVITSVLRTKGSVKRLKKHNRNAISASSHLHGTTFDISYATFFLRYRQIPIASARASHLKEALALTLFELRNAEQCWVKYELYQTCFHVVCKP